MTYNITLVRPETTITLTKSDVAIGVASGGTTGQVLAKASDANYDTEWVNQSVGGGTWGSITGTLSNQTDLQNVLNNISDNIFAFTSNFVNNMNREVKDQNIVVLSDSTGDAVGEWAYLTMQYMAALWPTHTVKYALWNTGTLVYNSLVTYQTGTSGTPKILTMYIGGASGQGAAYAVTNFATIIPVVPDICFVSYGHNDNPANSLIYKRTYLATTKKIRENFRKCNIICIAQNPKLSSAGTYLNGLRGAIDIGEICADENYGFINVMSRFFDYGDYSTLMKDDTHPNALGSALWQQTVCLSFVKKNYSSPAIASDKTESIYIPVSQFYNGAVTLAATTLNNVPIAYAPLPDAADTSISASVQIPSWWKYLATYIIWKTPSNSSTTAVRFTQRMYSLDENDAAPTSIGVVSQNVTGTATVGKIMKSQIFSVAGAGDFEISKPTKPIVISIYREGTNVADTYTGNAEVLGVLFERKL